MKEVYNNSETISQPTMIALKYLSQYINPDTYTQLITQVYFICHPFRLKNTKASVKDQHGIIKSIADRIVIAREYGGKRYNHKCYVI